MRPACLSGACSVAAARPLLDRVRRRRAVGDVAGRRRPARSVRTGGGRHSLGAGCALVAALAAARCRPLVRAATSSRISGDGDPGARPSGEGPRGGPAPGPGPRRGCARTGRCGAPPPPRTRRRARRPRVDRGRLPWHPRRVRPVVSTHSMAYFRRFFLRAAADRFPDGVVRPPLLFAAGGFVVPLPSRTFAGRALAAPTRSRPGFAFPSCGGAASPSIRWKKPFCWASDSSSSPPPRDAGLRAASWPRGCCRSCGRSAPAGRPGRGSTRRSR